ncbi:hypothetical protein [Laceyella putida]|uniref:hypothetical protein n=1 Tax=Laceyella putida TaxID=110101 RepID=UPI00364247D4
MAHPISQCSKNIQFKAMDWEGLAKRSAERRGKRVIPSVTVTVTAPPSTREYLVNQPKKAIVLNSEFWMFYLFLFLEIKKNRVQKVNQTALHVDDTV